MADTFTTILNLTKPEIGASTDTWGTKLNADLDTLDSLFQAGPALKLANGGTGSTTAAGARTNLGLAIGTDIPSPTGGGASGTWNISISGSAASASSASSASSAGQLSSGSWSVYASGTYLYFRYNGNDVMRLDSSGNLVAEANVTAYSAV